MHQRIAHHLAIEAMVLSVFRTRRRLPLSADRDQAYSNHPHAALSMQESRPLVAQWRCSPESRFLRARKILALLRRAVECNRVCGESDAQSPGESRRQERIRTNNPSGIRHTGLLLHQLKELCDRLAR